MNKQKKIAIYTIQDYNYGNRLQNFATQALLKKLGHEAISLKTVNYRAIAKDISEKKCKRYIAPAIIFLIKKLYDEYSCFAKKDRESNFNLFNRKIKYSYDCITTNEIILGKYDCVLVGSDQIWNTNFDFVSINSFLPFHHPNKIAFSASFGVNAIPHDHKIVECLNDFKALSVREEAGAKIIKKLTGRDATVLVDPTMLLTKDEWRKVSKKPRRAKEGYILTYFLSPKCDEAITKLKEVRGDKEVYELLNPNDKVAGTAGPSEFLWLFEHADLILTDSFHACVFSFLFNKPFIVYDRNWDGGNMNSRLETLLSKFHLERKYANSGIENDTWEHDYTEGYTQLEIERKTAIDFLKKALED